MKRRKKVLSPRTQIKHLGVQIRVLRNSLTNAQSLHNDDVARLTKQHDERFARMTRDSETQAKLIAELRQTIARKDEDIARRDSMVAIRQGELERMVRLVDQFTSVAIVPFGSVQIARMDGGTPIQLRNTGGTPPHQATPTPMTATEIRSREYDSPAQQDPRDAWVKKTPGSRF